jgi:hypothetical protein
MNIVDSVGRLFGGDGDIAKERDPIFFLREWDRVFNVSMADLWVEKCSRRKTSRPSGLVPKSHFNEKLTIHLGGSER